MQKRFPAWSDWLEERRTPTIKQLEELARYTHLPFGVFFLDAPPVVELPIPDYRLGKHGDRGVPSQELLDVIDASVRRQAWLSEYVSRHELPGAQFERITEEVPPSTAAQSVSMLLGFTVEDRSRLRTRENARNHLRRRFEELGGVALISSMVGNDNHRMLDRNEFRGFTLADPVVPLIFINSSGESLSGQIFTFMHEFGHVLLGRSGVSDEDPKRSGSAVEDWCNAFASEVLVPASDLLAQYREVQSVPDELDRLSSRYFCSPLVVLLKLRELGMVEATGFEALYAAEEQRSNENYELSRQRGSGGGDFYANQPFRTSERLSRAVLADVREGGTSYTEAFRVLGLRSAEQLRRYAEQLGV